MKSKFLNIDLEKAQVKYQFREGGNPFTDLPFSARMDTDVLAGFKSAARNNQTLLALEYLGYVLDLIDEALYEQEQTPETQPDPAPRKVTKSTKTPETVSAADEDV